MYSKWRAEWKIYSCFRVSTPECLWAIFLLFIQEVVIINIQPVSQWPHSTLNMKAAFLPSSTGQYSVNTIHAFLLIPRKTKQHFHEYGMEQFSGKVWTINFISPAVAGLLQLAPDYYFPNWSSETRAGASDTNSNNMNISFRELFNIIKGTIKV